MTDKPQTAHQHLFVIPVEYRHWAAQGNLTGAISKTVVTKLRCECGEEIDR